MIEAKQTDGGYLGAWLVLALRLRMFGSKQVFSKPVREQSRGRKKE
jgi:hypothetical protein